MISKRKDPDENIISTSKPILDAPIYPDYPENTPKGRMPKDDPELLRNTKVNKDDVNSEIEDLPIDNLDDEEDDLDR